MEPSAYLDEDGLRDRYLISPRTAQRWRVTGVGPAFASIQIADGRFQLDAHGDAKAFVIPVRVGNPLTAEASDPTKAVRHGILIDLIAVSPSYPDRWALRVGNATWLGAIEPQF